MVYAESPNNSYVVDYDIDDFTEYLKKYSDGANTRALVEEYSKNYTKHVTRVIVPDDPDLYEIKEVKGKQVKAPKKIKKVMINDNQSITFYADGSFGTSTMKKGNPTKITSDDITLRAIYSDTAQHI